LDLGRAGRRIGNPLFDFPLKGTAMDRAISMDGSHTDGGSPTNPISAKVEGAAQAAHQTTDKIADKATAQVDRIADKATAQVDRLSGTAHRAVNTAADAASSAAEWVSAIPEQVKDVRVHLTEAASASIRTRPIAMVAGALVIGYLLGRFRRL
jgi:cell division septum initiation protein DivIVA